MQHRCEDTRADIVSLSHSLHDVSNEDRRDVSGIVNIKQVNVLLESEAGLVCNLLQTTDSCTQNNVIYMDVRRNRQGEKGSAREQTHAFQRAGEQ